MVAPLCLCRAAKQLRRVDCTTGSAAHGCSLPHYIRRRLPLPCYVSLQCLVLGAQARDGSGWRRAGGMLCSAREGRGSVTRRRRSKCASRALAARSRRRLVPSPRPWRCAWGMAAGQRAGRATPRTCSASTGGDTIRGLEHRRFRSQRGRRYPIAMLRRCCSSGMQLFRRTKSAARAGSTLRRHVHPGSARRAVTSISISSSSMKPRCGGRSSRLQQPLQRCGLGATVSVSTVSASTKDTRLSSPWPSLHPRRKLAKWRYFSASRLVRRLCFVCLRQQASRTRRGGGAHRLSQRG